MKSAYISLKARIFTGIALAILVPLVIGITSLMNMRRMTTFSQTLFYSGAAPLQMLAQIGVSFQRMRIASRDLLEAEGPAAAAKYTRQLDQLSGEIEKISESYAGTGLSPEQRGAFQHYQEVRKSYLDYVVQLRILAQANRAQDGWHILHGEPYNRVIDAHLAAIKTLESLQIAKAERLVAASTELARTAVLQVLAAMFLAIAFSAGAGLWLDRLSGQTVRAQEALRISEERFQFASRATNDGIWDWDLVTGAVLWNENLQTNYGYAPNEIEPGVEGWKSHIHPGDLERVEQSLTSAIQSGQNSWASEFRFRRRDGSYADVLDRGYITRNAAGEPIRMVGAMTDLSAQKRAELQYRALFENVNDPVFVLGFTNDGRLGTFQQVNDVACNRLGYTREELLQLSPRDIGAAEWSIQRNAAAAQLAAGEPVLFEAGYVAKDGHHIPVEVSARVFLLDGQRTVLAISRDLTLRKKAEAALRTSEEQFRQLADNIPEVFFVLTADPVRMVYLSPAYEEVWGKSRQEAYERPEAWIEAVHPEDREAVGAFFARSVQGVRGEMPYRVVRPDGSVRWIEARSFPVMDAQGKFIRVVGIAEDTTLRRETHQKLNIALERLQQQAQDAAKLAELVDVLQSCQNTEEAFKVTGTILQDTMRSTVGALYIISPSRDVLEMVASWGHIPDAQKAFLPDDCWALRRSKVHRVDAAGSPLRCGHVNQPAEHGYICVPLAALGESLGVLYVQNAGDPVGSAAQSAYPDAEMLERQATAVGERVSLALANLRLREVLRGQSIRDPMTGIFNRRFMEEFLERELRRATRGEQQVALMMLDIDHFKRFNDTFGHQAGDEMLRAVGSLLKETCRMEDIACRYGGEEFVIVLAGTSLEIAQARAEQLRERTKQLNVRQGGQLLGMVTVSIGIAVFPENGEDAAHLLKAADDALYRAKEIGRDRVVAASPLSTEVSAPEC